MPWSLRIRLFLSQLKTPICVVVVIAIAAIITLELIRAGEYLTWRIPDR